MTRTATLERPDPAPWLAEAKGTAEEQRLRAELKELQAALADKEQSIEFLRDLLNAKWFEEN